MFARMYPKSLKGIQQRYYFSKLGLIGFSTVANLDLKIDYLASASKKPTTHLKREVDRIQQENKDHILLVQVGGFYEIYDCGSYLDEIAALLGLRVGVHKAPAGVSQDHRFQRFAGFPRIALRNHLDVLIANGKTVAIVDQLKPSATSEVITRKVVRIVTPGTLLDEGDLKSLDNNFLLSLYPKFRSKNLGMAWTDVSTGEFNISSTTIKQLQDDLWRIQPKEIIIPLELYDENQDLQKILPSSSALITKKPQILFSKSESVDKLSKFIISSDPSKAIFANRPSDVLKSLKPLQSEAACGLISYLKETFPSIEGDLCLRGPSEVTSGSAMKIDSISLESLEIMKTQRQKSKKGSLISILDKTKTAPGHRLLLSRLKAPSTSLEEIQRRLDLVEVFYKDQHLNATVADLLSKCKDLERGLQRIHFGTGSPSDLFNVVSTINTCTEIKVALIRKIGDADVNCSLVQALRNITNKLGDFEQLCSSLGNFLSEDRMTSNALSTGVINSGICTDLDKERDLYQDLVLQQEQRMSELSEIFKLKASLIFDARIGPVIDLGKPVEKTAKRIDSVIEAIPEIDYVSHRRNGTIKLKDELWTRIYHDLQDKRETLLTLESELFEGACSKLKANTVNIVEMCKAIAELDVSSSIAGLSIDNGFTRPIIVDDDHCTVHRVKNGRHAVVESHQLVRGNTFIVNDSNLSSDKELIWLLTGPNMGGKSTFLRQCALLSIMAQTGFYVPCSSAKLSIVDQIFTRIGSSDDLSANQSTFMVEMQETAFILNNATSKSLVIMDEVGRGTSTKDGISLAFSILNHLATVNKCMCIFATHYHELAVMLKDSKLNNIGYYQAESQLDENSHLKCLYKIKPGVMDKSHGIQIAAFAGLPRSVIKQATKIYKQLEI